MANLDKKIQELEKALNEITPIFKEFSKGVKSNGSKGILIDTSQDAMEDLYSKLDELTSKIIGDTSGTGTAGSYGANYNGFRNTSEAFDSLMGKAYGISDSFNYMESQMRTLNTTIGDVTSVLNRAFDAITGFTTSLSNVSTITGSESSGKSQSVNPYDGKLNAIIEEIASFHTDFNGNYASRNLSSTATASLVELQNLRTEQELRDRKYKQEIRKPKDERDNEFIKKYEEERKREDQYNKEYSRRRENDWSWREFGKGAISLVEGVSKNFISNEPVTASKTADSMISGLSKMLPGIAGQITGAVLGVVKGLVEMGTKRDRAASEYARTVGGGAEGRTNFMLTVSDLMKKNEYHFGDLALKFDDIYSAMTETAEALGRVTDSMNPEDVKSLVLLKKFGIDANSINQFDTFGYSPRRIEAEIANVYKRAGATGLTYKNLSKAVVDNLKLAQRYTFKDGMTSLERMAERSVALKYNMQQVATFADKVSTVEGAMKAAANLSVLGGQFALNSDPLQLLYESLNDFESLNERMLDMFGNQAFFNTRTGQMDLAPFQREQMKAAAEAIGVSYDEMLNMSFNRGRENIVGKQIDSQATVRLPEDVKGYIKHLATLDSKGNASVMIGDIEKRISELREGDFEYLKRKSERKSKAENADLGTIYSETSNIAEKLDNMLQWLQEKLGTWMMKIVSSWIFGGGNNQMKAELKLRDIENDEQRAMAMDFFQKHRGTNAYGNDVTFAERIRSAISSGEGNSFYKEIKDAYEGRHHDIGYTPSLDKKVPGYSQFSGTQMDSQLFGNFRQIIDRSSPKRGVPAEMDGSKIVVHDGEVIVPEWAVAGKEDMWRDMVRNGYNPASETHQTKLQNDALAKYQDAMRRDLDASSRGMLQQVNGNLQSLSATMNNMMASTNLERVHQPMRVAPVASAPATLGPMRMGVDFGNIPTMNVRVEGYGNIGQADIRKIAMECAMQAINNAAPLIKKQLGYSENLAGFDKEKFAFRDSVVSMYG